MTPHAYSGQMRRKGNRHEVLHDHTPHTPSLLCHSKAEGNRRVSNRNKRVKIDLRTKVRSEDKVLFALSLFSRCPAVFIIPIDYINFPQTKTAFPVTVFDKWSSLLYLSPQAFYLIFPKDLSYKDRVRQLMFFNLEKRGLQGDIIEVLQYLKGPIRHLERNFWQEAVLVGQGQMARNWKRVNLY